MMELEIAKNSNCVDVNKLAQLALSSLMENVLNGGKNTDAEIV